MRPFNHWTAGPRPRPAIGAIGSVVCLVALAFPASSTANEGATQKVGKPLVPWTSGTLDIHHINTGKGNATFFIFPDGTTFLADAGATTSKSATPPRPDGSRSPGTWIARYVARMFPAKRKPVLDYALISHFHGDHMGDLPDQPRPSTLGRYTLTGITEVAEQIRIRTMIDRGWPKYDFPGPLEPRADNYRAFLDWHTRERKLHVERFQAGRRDQIKLLHEPRKYPSFAVQNIAANGEVWTGHGTAVRMHFPPLETLPPTDRPTENMCSIVFRLTYGHFDYYSGGDLPGGATDGAPEWHDVQTAVAEVVGPVDVHLLDHHGYVDSANAFLLSHLRPRVHLAHVWSPGHLASIVVRRLFSERLYAGPRDIFATNMLDATRVVLGGGHVSKMKSSQGHILVRVRPGGDRYSVLILDDSDESGRVVATHGPYEAR